MLEVKGEIADIETRLKRDKAQKEAKKENIKIEGIEGLPAEVPLMSPREIQELKEQKAALEERQKELESIANEKEAIYFELLDQAAVALRSDIDLDDEAYVKLAQNINLVAQEIDESATEAYTTFGIAAAQLTANNAIVNFPKELQTLAIAKMYIPLNLQDKYNERIARLVKNVLLIFPNMMMGTYYAHKQAALAQKYKEFTDVIVEAYNTKVEQEAQAEAAKAQQAAQKAAQSQE